MVSLLCLLALLSNPEQEVINAHVTFEISHMGVLTVEGIIEEIQIKLRRKSKDLWIATGEIDARSIQTGNANRDETIQTEQYLNVKTYPSIPFKATIRKNELDLSIKVDLELRGIPVAINSVLEISNGKLVSKPVIISRSEIGLDFGAMDTLIGDEIELVIRPDLNIDDLFMMTN